MSEYLDPTDSVAVPRKTAPRPSSLDGKIVTLLDISKAKGDHLLDRIEELLRERARPKAIVRKKKPTFADRKSTRLNSSHSQISYAVFCLKKKKKHEHEASEQLKGTDADRVPNHMIPKDNLKRASFQTRR